MDEFLFGITLALRKSQGGKAALAKSLMNSLFRPSAVLLLLFISLLNLVDGTEDTFECVNARCLPNHKG